MSADNTPRFAVGSFNYAVSLQMNLLMAEKVFRLIKSQEQGDGSVDPALYACAEKIKHQFYRMNKLGLLERKVEDDDQSRTIADSGEETGRQPDGGTATEADVHDSDGND